MNHVDLLKIELKCLFKIFKQLMLKGNINISSNYFIYDQNDYKKT